MLRVEDAYANGLEFADYRARLRAHAEAFDRVYRRLAFVVDEERDRAPLGDGRILVLTEAFCIDSVLNTPLIARLAEASPNVRLRIASRDAYPDLAQAFPGRGNSSRVPTVVFLGAPGEVRGYWTERSARDHEWMARFLAEDPIPDLILDDGVPTPILAAWMERRLARQEPFFEAQSWRDVAGELRAVARTPVGAASRPAAGPP